MGGSWYFDGGVGELRDVSAGELAQKLAHCDRILGNARDNRKALQGIVEMNGGINYGRACYNGATRNFVAGTLFYSENLIDHIVFLTLARGASDVSAPGALGLAVIHDYVFGEPDTQAALRIGPDGASSLLDGAAKAEAAETFQALADEMLATEEQARTISELDTLR